MLGWGGYSPIKTLCGGGSVTSIRMLREGIFPHRDVWWSYPTSQQGPTPKLCPMGRVGVCMPQFPPHGRSPQPAPPRLFLNPRHPPIVAGRAEPRNHGTDCAAISSCAQSSHGRNWPLGSQGDVAPRPKIGPVCPTGDPRPWGMQVDGVRVVGWPRSASPVWDKAVGLGLWRGWGHRQGGRMTRMGGGGL